MTPAQRRLALLALVLSGGLAGVALLVALELGLRAAGLGEGPPAYDPFHGFSAAVPLFEPGRRADGTRIFAVSHARLSETVSRHPAREREFLATKPRGGFRIFVVGESSAAGFPYTTAYAFPAWLERRLEAALPGVPSEVVNAAIVGYSSRRALRVTREIALHQPDLVIVYSGHNEWAEQRHYSRLLDMDPRLFQLRERLIATRLFTVLSRSRLLRPTSHRDALEGFLTSRDRDEHEMFAVVESRVEGHGYATPEELAQRDALYRLNLEEIVRAARSAGAEVMLLTLSQNFADWAPGASTHRAGLGAADAARFAALLEAGERAREADACEEALRSFEAALALDAEYAGLHWKIAQCQRRLGAFEAAHRHYRRASDLDRVPFGAPTYFNDVIRETARTNGLLLVDVDAAMRQESEHGLVGDDLFVEFAHPNLRANQRIAAEIARALREAGIPRPTEEWRDGYRERPPEALYAANPELRIREHEAIRVMCLLAQRAGCVEQQTARLAELRAR